MMLTEGRKQYFNHAYEIALMCLDYWRNEYKENDRPKNRHMYAQHLKIVRELKKVLDTNCEPS